MLAQTYLSLGLTVGGVLLIVFVFFSEKSVAVLVAVALASLDACVIGYMSFWGQRISSVSLIALVMSVGFSVDYLAHVALAFAETTRVPLGESLSSLGRTKVALDKVAAPVFQSGVSTLLGILPTAFSQSNIFFAFFSVSFLVILFGLLHGLVLVPVFLAGWGNKSRPRVQQGSHRVVGK
jgi:multidrug efflux pump subunit AcrB